MKRPSAADSSTLLVPAPLIPSYFPVPPTVGWAKFWGTVTVTGPDEFTGTMSSENYDLAGHLLFAASGGTSVAERIEVQVEAQP